MPKGTLCWNCKKACSFECSWTENKQPVKGWIAKETIIPGMPECYRNSYIVKQCPEFIALRKKNV